MRDTFIKKLVEYAEKDKNIILLTDDLGTGCLEHFIEKFPDRFFNCGIAEQNMVGMASGLAMEGKKVFMYAIGNFVSERALEFLRDLVCYHNLDVKYVGVGAGFEYGSLGVTHHATDDVSALRALPNMQIFSPANVSECEKAMETLCTTKAPAYLRLNKKANENVENFKCKNVYNITECYAGKTTAILATGGILTEAIKCGEILSRENVYVGVYSVPCIKPINRKEIELLANRYDNIITLEEHTIIGGFGSSVCEIVAETSAKAQVTRFGILDEFTSKVGKQNELRKYYHIDCESLMSYIKGKLC